MGDDDRKEWSRMELASIMNEYMADLQAQTDKKIDRLIDGAQAAIYTQAMMVGDPSMGLKGFIPETQRRLDEFAAAAETSRKLYDSRDAEQNGRLTGIEGQLTEIVGRQQRIRKGIREIAESATRSNGKWDYMKLSALIAATYEAVTLATPHIVSGWIQIKKIAAAMVAATAK